MYSLWQSLVVRDRVAQRTADWRQETDTIKWSSEQCAQDFTWINEICRQTPMYSSASLQHNLAPRRSPCNTLLRRVGLLPSRLSQPFWIPRLMKMMMIAFITTNSGLVPLIEGLCARVWTSSLKIDEIDKSISSIQASKSQKRDFEHFSGVQVCYSNENVRFENFMHMEWCEEKFWKGIVGDKRRLRFWHKHQKI